MLGAAIDIATGNLKPHPHHISTIMTHKWDSFKEDTYNRRAASK